LKSFEQQTVDAIKMLTTLVVILAIGVGGAIGFGAWGFARASSDGEQLKQVVREQEAAIHSPKHVSDIAIWCDAINGLQASLTAYVNIFVQANHRIPPLTLKQLDCPAIERQSPGAAPKPR
jgi:hypothetical protein